jgi:hypothetical protein
VSDDNLLTIGDFAVVSGLSINALRSATTSSA